MTLTCLIKIKRDMDIEIIVVDNNSNDFYDFDLLRKDFPSVMFIKNEINLGFGEANNIGVKNANSSNLLILNPDTIISKELIHSGIQKLEETQVGAVAVKMIDGSGSFLPESRRGFPSLLATLFKFIGLHRIFPQSRLFNQYYLGSKEDPNTIEVLSGACFFIRIEVYNQIGGFDKQFFMYGEDVDLSYQLAQYGYQIKYLSDHEIVHFKGKSSSKTSWNYQTAFYNAMLIYWKKNFKNSHGRIYTFFLEIIIFGLKIFSILKHTIIASFWPLLDTVTIYSCIALLSDFWASFIKYDADFFPKSFYTIILPLYTIVWIFSLFISNFYQKTIEIQRLFKGAAIGSFLTLLLYFILQSEYKFSRGILILSIGLKFFIPLILRLISQFFTARKVQLSETVLFSSNFLPKEFNKSKFAQFLIENSTVEVVAEVHESKSLVIDIETCENSTVISSIAAQEFQSIWLYSTKGQYLIQSLGKSDKPNIIAEDTNLNIQRLSSQFMKRLLDINFSIVMMIISPFQIQKSKEHFRHAMNVLFHGWTWMSIDDPSVRAKYKLKRGVFSLAQHEDSKSDVKYLRHYSVGKEFSILLKQMFKL